MSPDGGDEYKRTVFDKRGPEAAHFLQTVGTLVIPIVAGAFIGGALAVQRGYPCGRALRPGTTSMFPTDS
jgi:hypothetical protein